MEKSDVKRQRMINDGRIDDEIINLSFNGKYQFE
jgi:hypothetical protein